MNPRRLWRVLILAGLATYSSVSGPVPIPPIEASDASLASQVTMTGLATEQHRSWGVFLVYWAYWSGDALPETDERVPGQVTGHLFEVGEDRPDDR